MLLRVFNMDERGKECFDERVLWCFVMCRLLGSVGLVVERGWVKFCKWWLFYFLNFKFIKCLRDICKNFKEIMVFMIFVINVRCDLLFWFILV